MHTPTQMHTRSHTLRVCELGTDRDADPSPKDLAWEYDVVREQGCLGFRRGGGNGAD